MKCFDTKRLDKVTLVFPANSINTQIPRQGDETLTISQEFGSVAATDNCKLTKKPFSFTLIVKAIKIVKTFLTCKQIGALLTNN